ncbi:MAG: hypothetical protein A2284_12910 [Deltaproteobacteria bacterium RIFOXYA12_FULL_61_11]|nr:MAG: hypothetical protein A2284_12910 [Deltaproteobacteria bacterium RIFOXYA12_FULL_61_11]
MNMLRQRTGMIVVSILIILSLITAVTLILVRQSMTDSQSQRKESVLLALDLALQSVQQEGRSACFDLKTNNLAGFTEKLQNGTALFDPAPSLGKFDRKLNIYTYNIFLSDNDDGDGDTSLDADGVINLRISAYLEGNAVRTLDVQLQIDPVETYPPSVLRQHATALRTCFEDPYRGHNAMLDLDRGGSATPIRVDGTDRDGSSDVVDGSTNQGSGFISNGAFGTGWYADLSDDLVYLTGNGGLTGAGAVTEATNADCTTFTALEEAFDDFLAIRSSDPRLVLVTPSTVSYDLSTAKVVTFDASGGGFLEVTPTSGSTITLGSAAAPLVVIVKGKPVRCTEDVDQAFYGGMFSPCPFSSGDGSVRFSGNVEGYGLLLLDGSTEITGNLTWSGHLHVVMGAGNIGALASSSACEEGEEDPPSEDPENPCDSGKTALCHYPPGNPAARHTICVSSNGNAVATHMAHGDTMGICPDSPPPEPPTEPDCSPDIVIPPDIGNVLEVKGNTRILGSMQLNRTTGTPVVGDLLYGTVVNHNIVLRGSTNTLYYSNETLERTATALEELFNRKEQTYSKSFR